MIQARTLAPWVAALAGGALSIGTPAAADPPTLRPETIRAPDSESVVPRVHRAIRMPPGATIAIDGQLDDPAWALAEEVTGFVSLWPPTGTDAPVATTVRALYDDDALYFAARMRRAPDEPQGVLPLRRDEQRNIVDQFGVKLDVTFDGRTSYLFFVSRNDRQSDLAMLDNGRQKLWDWDSLWDSATSVGADEWVAEVRIPFAVLGLPPGTSWLGVQYIRNHRASRAYYAWWTYVDPSYSASWNPHFGRLAGLEGAATGRPLSILPYVRTSYEPATPESDTLRDGFDTTSKLGVDMRMRLASNLWASATLMPDFGDVDLDDVILQLDRFPLLLPEKRPFFLTGLSIFDFGHDPRARLFTSRRIGLRPGEGYLPLFGGLKVYGRQGPFAIGLLDAVTGSPTTNWNIARLEYESQRGSIGVMSTSEYRSLDGDDVSVAAVGVDGDVRLFGGKLVVGSALSGSGGDAPSALSSQSFIRWNGQRLRPELSALWVEDDYAPPAGFLARSGILRVDLAVPWTVYEEAGLNELTIAPTAALLTDDDVGQRLGYVTALETSASADAWTGSVRAGYSEDLVLIPFTLLERAPIPAGRYRGPSARLSLARDAALDPFVSATAEYQGGYFGGTLLRFAGQVQLGRLPWLHVYARFDEVHIDVPDTAPFWTHQVAGGALMSTSPTWSLDATWRWDSVSQDMTGMARLGWRFVHAAELILVYQNLVVEDVRQQRAIAKLQYQLDLLLGN